MIRITPWPSRSCQARRTSNVLKMCSPNSGQRAGHLPERSPVELDHVRLLDGDARADRRLTRERRDVTDERAAVGLGDMDFLAGLAVDELDQPSLDHEERRVAHSVLVEHFAGLERPALAALPEPRE